MGLMGAQAVGALQGLLGARRAAALARMRRERAVQDYLASMDARRVNDATAGNREMYGYAGTGGDAIAAGYQTAVANDAGAGVYGSTAAAGMRQKALDTLAGGIADMDVRNKAHLADLWAEAQGNAARMRAGYASEDLASAQDQYQNSLAGVSSLAGALQSMQKPRVVAPSAGSVAGANLGMGIASGMMGVPSGMAPRMAPNGGVSLGTQVQQQFQGVRDWGRGVGPARNGMNNGSTNWLTRVFTLPSNRRRPGFG